jgi:hypothetical protein
MTEALDFISKHRGKGALLDANLLIVYLVGKYDMDMMRSFHHTKQYVEDFPLIERLVAFFRIIHTTPNVLTEVSSLGKSLGSGFYDTLQRAITGLDEKFCLSKDAATNPHFNTIGLTDSGLMSLAANGILIVTADWPLYSILRSKDIEAVNINHLRPLYWSGSF